MNMYTDLNKLSAVEECRNKLLSSFEIPICIEELEYDISIQNEWLNRLSTNIKQSANAYNINTGTSIHTTIKQAKNYIIYANHRIKELKKEQLTYLN